MKAMNESMIVTGNQFRSARALLDEQLGECSARSSIPVATLWRLESAGSNMPQALTSTLGKLIGHFERAGIRFINDEERVGVVLQRAPKPSRRLRK
jgi:hypothetical protein